MMTDGDFVMQTRKDSETRVGYLSGQLWEQTSANRRMTSATKGLYGCEFQNKIAAWVEYASAWNPEIMAQRPS